MGAKNGQKIAGIINDAKIASNPLLQLSSPNCYTCSIVVFRTMLWETPLLVHLLSLTKTCPKSKLAAIYVNIALILSLLANTTGFLAQLQWCSPNTKIVYLDLLPPWGRALGTGARSKGNGGGDPALATDTSEDGNSKGVPVLAADACRNDNGNSVAQQEGEAVALGNVRQPTERGGRNTRG